LSRRRCRGDCIDDFDSCILLGLSLSKRSAADEAPDAESDFIVLFSQKRRQNAQRSPRAY
jgi:hypothetical protein